jgi:CRP-like cAMP-binding protein
MTTVDKHTLLATHFLFRDLDDAIVERIMALGTTRRLAADEVLFLKGDEGDALYGVLGGRVRIGIGAASGKEVTLAIMEPGDIFGEIALLDSMARSADASAMAQSQLFTIRRREFVDYLEREPGLATHLLRLVCGRVRSTSELVEDSAFLALPARLAKRLLGLASVGRAAPGAAVVTLSQQELGRLLGTSRETVNKHLREWRQVG